MNIKESILNIVDQYNNVSFPELEQLLKVQGLEHSGSIALFVPGNKNLLYWNGMS